jgi:pantoate kinase
MKITQSQLNQIIKEEIKAVLEDLGGDPNVDPDMEAAEPVDITAGMSDEEVENLARQLTAAAHAMESGDRWDPDEDDW